MSTLAISQSIPRQEVTKAEPQKNSLNRYVEYDPAKLASKHTCKEKVWKVAAIVTLVAYTLIVAIGSVISGLFFPSFIPIVIASAITLTPFIFPLYKNMQAWAKKNADLAQIENGVVAKLNKLPKSPAEIEAKLQKDLNIDPKKIKNLDKITDVSRLRPTIARYEYWEEQSDACLKASLAHAKEGFQVDQEKAKSPFSLTEHRLEALDKREDAQIAKVQAAFLLHVLRNPMLPGDENKNELFSFKILSPTDRLLRKEFEDPSNDMLIELKDEKKTTFSIEQLSGMKIEDISRAIASGS